MDRAYSVLTVKSFDEDLRVLEGIASTPTTDRMGDIVEPLGAEFKLPIPLLWQHDHSLPIGEVISAKVTEEGIHIKAKLARIESPESLKNRLDEAWALIKSKLVRGLSIGFQSLESARIDGTFGIHFLRWSWLELSAVTIPANAEASIQTIKSIDEKQRRAASAVVRLSPGASGSVSTTQTGKHMKTIQERIQEYQATRAAKHDEWTSIMNKANEEGRTLDEAEAEKYDTLKGEIAEVDKHLDRLNEQAKFAATSATKVLPNEVTSPEAGAQARGGVQPIRVTRNLPKGTAFTRYAMALAATKGNRYEAIEMAKQLWEHSTPEVVLALKGMMQRQMYQRAAVAYGDTVDSGFAEPLVEYQTMASEFIDLLRPATILGRVSGLRQVPFNIRVAGKTQGATVGWVGQGSPKPVSELVFNEVTLGFAKCAGIVVISQELARFSDPAAEGLIRQDMIDTVAAFMDDQFIDPAVAAVANVSPAAITNGATVVTSAGTSLDNIYTDVNSAFSNLVNNELDPSRAVWVMHPAIALALALTRNSQDVRAFPDVTVNGGTWFGLPVVTSTAVPKTASGGSIIALFIPGEIFYADDGAVRLDVSEQASVQMDSAPSAGAQSLVSLWQNNLIGIRAERMVNWQRRRNAAVTYIDAVNYTAV